MNTKLLTRNLKHRYQHPLRRLIIDAHGWRIWRTIHGHALYTRSLK